MTEHTPTPWHRNIPPASKYNTIFSGRNTHVLHLSSSGLDNKEIEANADFIVRAVNAHDDLVAALEAVIDYEDVMLPAGSYGEEVHNKARAALAKAKGTEQ
jgi:hypothetical protein